MMRVRYRLPLRRMAGELPLQRMASPCTTLRLRIHNCVVSLSRFQANLAAFFFQRYLLLHSNTLAFKSMPFCATC